MRIIGSGMVSPTPEFKIIVKNPDALAVLIQALTAALHGVPT